MDNLRTTFAVLLLTIAAAAHEANPATSGRLSPRARVDTRSADEIVTAGTSPQERLLGAWGGEHISLELTANGGTVEFDCAHGAIARAIAPDASGRFDVPGRYVEEHGGPVRQGTPSAGLAVRFSGRVEDGRMTLNVTRSATKARIGTFALERGREPLLVKCR